MSYEDEVRRFHRESPMVVAAEDALSTGELRHFVRTSTSATEPSRKEGPKGAAKSAGNLGKLAKGASKVGRAELAGEYARAAAHEANKVSKDDKDLVEWAKEEEHEKEHSGDALAVQEYRQRYGREPGADADTGPGGKEPEVGPVTHRREVSRHASDPGGKEPDIGPVTHRRERSKDASAAEVLEGAAHVSGAVKNVAAKAERGASIGARIAAGDGGPLGRAIRRNLDSTPAQRVARKEANKNKVSQQLGPTTRGMLAEGIKGKGGMPLHGKAGRKEIKAEGLHTRKMSELEHIDVD